MPLRGSPNGSPACYGPFGAALRNFSREPVSPLSLVGTLRPRKAE